MIPFLDIRASYLELKSEIDSAIARVLDSGSYILGPEVEAFETEWAAYCGALYAVGVGNGLDALILALRALGVGPGDEVIVPSNTYIATWLAVTAVGAKLVPVEPDPMTHNINPTLISAAITPATKVILPVHLYGQPADLDPVIKLARKHGLYVVEDGAQAHGARYKGKRIGAHGDVVCWSFYPGKNLGAMGDGGAITTDNADIAENIAVLRNYGSRQKYENEVRGVNSRLDPVQAAILRAKLPRLDAWTDIRRSVAAFYSERLGNAGLVLPHVPDWADSAWHLYVVRSPQRAILQAALTEAGIQTLIHYPKPPHLQQAYGDMGISDHSLPIAQQLANEVLSLPIGPHMAPQSLIEIVTKLHSALRMGGSDDPDLRSFPQDD